MKYLFYVISLIGILTFQVNAAEPTVDWVKEYGNEAGDGYAITQTSDDGYIISGMSVLSGMSGTMNFSTTKLDKNANLEWQKKFGTGSGWSVIQSNDGNYVTAGVLVDESSAVVKKLDKSGNTIWTYKLDNVLSSFLDHYIDVMEILDGNYIVSSFGQYKHSCTPSGSCAYSGALYVSKLSNSGSEIWKRKIEYPLAAASSIVETSEGGYAITGGAGSSYELPDNIIFLKLDKDGNVVKNVTLPKNTTDPNYGIRLIRTLDNGYAIIGNKRIIKLNNNADIEWDQPISGYSMIQLNDQSFVIATGYENLIKLSKDGKTQVWNKTIKTGFSAFGVSKDKCNGLIVTGTLNNKTAVAHLTDLDTTTCCSIPADTNGSTQEGINLVKSNPSSYELFSQIQVDAAKQTGVDLVKTKPADYNLFTQAQMDAVKQAGIDLVKTKPADYSLFTQTQIDTTKQTGIDLVKTKPADYGIVNQLNKYTKE